MRLSRNIFAALTAIAVFVGGTPPAKAAGEHDCCERSMLRIAAVEATPQAMPDAIGNDDAVTSDCRMDHTGIRGSTDVQFPPLFVEALVLAPDVALASPSARDIVAATGPPLYIVQLSLRV